MSKRITLSSEWLAKAIEVGRRRQAYADRANLEDYGTPNGVMVDHHIVGAVGEAVVAKALLQPWKANIGITTGDDVGAVEVRARRVPGTGTDLSIHPRDKDKKPYVLVHINPSRLDDGGIIIGWLFGKEAKERERKTWNKQHACWFVPPPYRTFGELLVWVDALEELT